MPVETLLIKVKQYFSYPHNMIKAIRVMALAATLVLRTFSTGTVFAVE